MPLKKIERKPLQTSERGLKALPSGGIKRQQMLNSALDFVDDRQADVLAGVKTEDLSEADHRGVIEKLDAALNPPAHGKYRRADIAKSMGQHQSQADQHATDHYCVLCFAEGDSVTAFLQRVGYPDPSATYIDGHVLAELLNIEMPKPKFRLPKIRPAQRTLARLVTAFPAKGE